MSSAEALRRIPLGNAIMIEAIAEDPTVAASLALQELSENYGDSITNISIHTTVTEADDEWNWEATAYASLNW